jgi:PAS domain S-box-containing protein
MKNQRETSLRIRFAGLAILALFIALAAAAYFSGRQVKRSSELIVSDAVPGMIDAHAMRMAMSRSIGWVMVAASAQTAQSRDASLKIVHDADTAFTNAVAQYQTTIKINPAEDQSLLNEVTSRFAEFQRQRMAYEALVLAGNRDGSAAFLETNLVPVYVSAIGSAEELLKYNNSNSTTYANYIRNSINRLYWAVAVVMVLSLICAAVLVVNFAIRRRELAKLRESEEKFAKAFQSSPSGITISELATGRIIEVNESYCRIQGYSSPQEMIGRTSVEVGVFSSAEERQRAFQPLLDGETLRDSEVQIRTPDGGRRTILFNAELIELGGKQCIVSLAQDITERKRATEQLEMLKVSIDRHFDGAFWMNTDNQFVYVNDSACKALGYTREELLGKPVTMIAPNATPQILEQVWKRLRETGFFTRESVHRRKDGSQFPIELVASYVRFEGKEFNCSFARDITERKRVERELQTSEERYRGLVNNMQDIIYTISADGIILFISPQVQNYGFTVEELIFRPFMNFIVPEDRAASVGRVQHTLATGEDEMATFRINAKDGRIVWFEEIGHPVRDAAGKITSISGMLRDVTARKQAEDELIWKTAFLEAQVDSALDGILVVDANEKRILHNQRLFELFNIPDDIARDNDDARLLQHVTGQTKNPKQFVERVTYLYAHPDEVGREEVELADGRILDRYSAPVRDKAVKYYGRIWTFRDITEQRKLEAQFRQSQKMEAVGQLASGVAHDFNNILGIIQMQSDLLKTEGNLSPAQTGYASEIGEAIERAAALTRQLLLFGRKEKMQARELDLNQSINDMTKMLRRTLGENIQLQFRFSMQPLFVNADAGMIDQVLMNLAVNARDAMPKGGKIIIEASAVEFDESVKDQYAQARPGSFVCLSVSDTGSGIPPEILPKIFEPFFTTKDVGKGTGLGLATVFGIVQQHKGWINVYSEIGQGTTFRIYIPRLAKISDQKFVAPLTEPASGGNETILVVEDEPKLRASVINILLRLGYNVLEASDGASALEVWNKHRDGIQLLLTDMVMPGGMTGKDLGGRLLKENPKLKVIYASGYSTDVAAKDFPLEEGVNFLSKPFQAQKLARIVRERLDSKI